MRIRLTLLAIVAVAALAWIAINHGLLAGARSAQTLQAPAATAALPLQTDAEPSAASTATSDHAAPSTMTAVEPTSADADSTAEQPAQATEASEKSGSRLAALEHRARAGDRKAARDWAEAVIECAAATYGEEFNPRPSHVSHLNWTQAEQRLELRVELLGNLIEECRLLFPKTAEDRAMAHWQSMVYEALALWAASGDPFGQLLNAQRERTWPPPLDVWRAQQALAVAHLDPVDPQTLVDLGEAFADGSRFMSEAWTLAACDLGYDCAAGGALQRRMCLSQMFCFEGSYEEVSLRLFSPRQWQIVQAQRRELLAMLQRGELAATFDVPPPGP
jgi:hypothetical protein